MKSIKVKSFVFPVLAVLVAIPSLAQSFEANPVSDVSSSAIPQAVPSMAYKNATADNQLAGILSVNQAPGLGDGVNTPLKVKLFRVDGLGMTNFRSNIFSSNDRASFTANAQTPIVNGGLSFIGTVSQTPLDSSTTKWLQVLSLVATQKINAAFSYSAKVNKYSRFESAITYRLHPTAGSGISDMAASFRYSIKF